MKRHIQYNYYYIFFFYFLFFLLFIACATLLVTYSLGYKINLKQYSIFQTGILRLQPLPANCDIYIDQTKKNFQTKKITEIPDLKPRDYLVEIKCTDYQTWSKKITIKPNLVHNEENILLIPVKPVVKDIAYITNYSNLNNQQILYQNINYLYLLDFISEKTFTYSNLPVSKNISLANINNNSVVIKNIDTKDFTMLNISNGNTNSINLPPSDQNINFLGNTSLAPHLILTLIDNNLYQIDLTQKLSNKLILSNISSPILLNDIIYFTTDDKNNYIQSYNILLGNTQSMPFKFNIKQIIGKTQHPDIIAIIDSQDITHFFQISKNLEIATIENKYISSQVSNNNFIIQTENELFLIDLNNNQNNHTLIRLSNPIDSFYLINNNNLLYSSKQDIYKMDLDGQNNQLVYSQEATSFNILNANSQKILVVANSNNQSLLQYIIINDNYNNFSIF